MHGDLRHAVERPRIRLAVGNVGRRTAGNDDGIVPERLAIHRIRVEHGTVGKFKIRPVEPRAIGRERGVAAVDIRIPGAESLGVVQREVTFITDGFQTIDVRTGKRHLAGAGHDQRLAGNATRRRRQLAGDIERVGDVEHPGILNARTLTERTATERQRTLIDNLARALSDFRMRRQKRVEGRLRAGLDSVRTAEQRQKRPLVRAAEQIRTLVSHDQIAVAGRTVGIDRTLHDEVCLDGCALVNPVLCSERRPLIHGEVIAGKQIPIAVDR